MRKNLFCFFLCLLAAFNVKAQDSVYNVSATEWIIPSTLIGMGISCHTIPQLTDFQTQLRDNLQADHHPKLSFDNYLQFLPITSVYALKACGLQSRHSYREISRLMAESFIFGAFVVYPAKDYISILRPDGSVRSSFPSGHTFFAFWGAETIRKEFGREYPLAAVAGYLVATTTAFMRMYNNRHWLGDVCAGAGIGILATDFTYWINSHLQKRAHETHTLPDNLMLQK